MQTRVHPFSVQDTRLTRQATLSQLKQWVNTHTDSEMKVAVLNVVIVYAEKKLMRRMFNVKKVFNPVASSRFKICEAIFNSIDQPDAQFAKVVQDALSWVTEKNSQLRDTLLPLLKISSIAHIIEAPIVISRAPSESLEEKQVDVQLVQLPLSVHREEPPRQEPIQLRQRAVSSKPSVRRVHSEHINRSTQVMQLIKQREERDRVEREYVRSLIYLFGKELRELEHKDLDLVVSTSCASLCVTYGLCALLDESFYVGLLVTAMTTAGAFLGNIAFNSERIYHLQQEQTYLYRLYDFYVYLTQKGSTGTRHPLAIEIAQVIAPYISTQDMLHWMIMPESTEADLILHDVNVSREFISIMAQAPHHVTFVRQERPDVRMEEGKLIVLAENSHVANGAATLQITPVLNEATVERGVKARQSLGIRTLSAVSSALYSLPPVKRTYVGSSSCPAGIPLPPKM